MVAVRGQRWRRGAFELWEAQGKYLVLVRKAITWHDWKDTVKGEGCGMLWGKRSHGESGVCWKSQGSEGS